ncbi:hypothetical protein IW140_002409 [Coemansia sp. RSA 1813]|nr:hypothetical protein EV178_000909 [Coemansia sp. RSA 1646]KAJ1773013.1 hypothetical protein LPJ74_000964 [Coemansia sp. RSA 1843]KAJ2092211.1 hypothetical protein IW138_001278 [Coemansia sp. RSA 986]KAJ2215347.1 hypothetical protein EV179_002295 [Coemansia sp. RSA 487]KAJ2570316.1 hypothetical protein IW140_002409 [Coemansia sp. RSA 1813]
MATGKKHVGAGVPMHYECSLHGLLTKRNEFLFRTRLEALCGDTESAHCELHHEISCVPCVETPIGPLRREDHMLRLRMELDPSDPRNIDVCKNTICMLGHPEPRSGRGASVRPAIYAQVFTGNAPQFLSLLGYKFHSEFVRKGYWFLYRNTFKIVVSQICRLEEQGNIHSAQAVDQSENWVVHIVADALTQEQVPRLCEQLDELKKMFADYVELVVVDHAFLENKIPYS